MANHCTSDAGARLHVATVRKSETAEIRVTRNVWKMRQVVDVRLWYLPASGGELVPSRKGFTIDAGKLPELIEALQGVA